jgi:hypothetical protein
MSVSHRSTDQCSALYLRLDQAGGKHCSECRKFEIMAVVSGSSGFHARPPHLGSKIPIEESIVHVQN